MRRLRKKQVILPQHSIQIKIYYYYLILIISNLSCGQIGINAVASTDKKTLISELGLGRHNKVNFIYFNRILDFQNVHPELIHIPMHTDPKANPALVLSLDKINQVFRSLNGYNIQKKFSETKSKLFLLKNKRDTVVVSYFDREIRTKSFFGTLVGECIFPGPFPNFFYFISKPILVEVSPFSVHVVDSNYLMQKQFKCPNNYDIYFPKFVLEGGHYTYFVKNLNKHKISMGDIYCTENSLQAYTKKTKLSIFQLNKNDTNLLEHKIYISATIKNNIARITHLLSGKLEQKEMDLTNYNENELKLVYESQQTNGRINLFINNYHFNYGISTGIPTWGKFSRILVIEYNPLTDDYKLIDTTDRFSELEIDNPYLIDSLSIGQGRFLLLTKHVDSHENKITLFKYSIESNSLAKLGNLTF